MQELEGKVAVVTGGGSGIGRGIALAMADAGMHVVVSDIEGSAAEAVADEVRAKGVKGSAVTTDVTDRGSVEDLATAAFGEHGAVHLLCNNAGVLVMGPLHTMKDDDWRWLLGVNLHGVVNGLQAFLPRMRKQAGAKHVVNTASGAGLFAPPGMGVYDTSKYAVVGLSEALREEGAGYGLGVSVLCPGVVRTNISSSFRNRPDDLGGAAAPEGWPPALPADLPESLLGMDPLECGVIVREAVLADELYVLPHPELRPMVQARFERIMAAFDKAEARRP